MTGVFLAFAGFTFVLTGTLRMAAYRRGAEMLYGIGVVLLIAAWVVLW